MPKTLTNKSDVIETLVGILINIIAKRVPVDNTSVKIDHIHHKVKFVPLPEGIIEEDYEETIVIPGEEGEEARTETIQHTKNTNYQAFIYVKIQQYEEEEEVPVEITGENVEEIDQTKTVVRLVDENQNFKAVSLQCREIPNLNNQTIFSVN